MGKKSYISLNKTSLKFANNSSFELFANLSIEEGERILLIGPNGSGKSSLIQIISGHITPSKGNVVLENIHKANKEKKEISELISYMPQSPYLPLHFDVFDFVITGRFSSKNVKANFSKNDYKLAIQILKKINLFNKWNSKLAHLSGGEKQLALLAHNLIQNKPIQLFDEPTSNLDPFNQSEVMNLILFSTFNKPVTTIVSTHDINFAWKFNRVIMIKNGVIFKDGSPSKTITTKNLSSLYGKEIKVKKINNKHFILTH
jgi:iron complex transport system ATP-binding protein